MLDFPDNKTKYIIASRVIKGRVWKVLVELPINPLECVLFNGEDIKSDLPMGRLFTGVRPAEST